LGLTKILTAGIILVFLPWIFLTFPLPKGLKSLLVQKKPLRIGLTLDNIFIFSEFLQKSPFKKANSGIGGKLIREGMARNWFKGHALESVFYRRRYPGVPNPILSVNFIT